MKENKISLWKKPHKVGNLKQIVNVEDSTFPWILWHISLKLPNTFFFRFRFKPLLNLLFDLKSSASYLAVATQCYEVVV